MDPDTRSTSLRVAGGGAAPRAAREAVISVLEEHVDGRVLGDAQLIVSELVTNSVVAQMGSGDSIGVDIGVSDDRVRIAVADDGAASVPHAAEHDAGAPNGRGLLLVERLSHAWGVIIERSGATHVWCELLLGPR